MRKTAILNIFLYILAILLGLLSGFLDFTGSEVQIGGFLVFVFAFVFGIIRPNIKTAWTYGVLVGLGVPLMHIVLRSYGLKEANPLQPNLVATFTAIIPGIFGAYVAVFTRKFMDEKNKPLVDEEMLKRETEKPNIDQETVPEFKSKHNVPKV